MTYTPRRSQPGDPLTPRQAAVYEFIVKHVREKGRPPTLRAIMRELHIASPNGVVCHLLALQQKGRIAVDEGKACGIRLLCANPCPLCGRA